MRTAQELLPVGIFVAIAAAATYVLLDRGTTAGPWLLAALLVGHGWVHVMFLFPAPDPADRDPGAPAYPFVMSNSWLIGRAGLSEGGVRALGLALIAATLACSVLAALGTVGWLVPTGWWGGLVVGAAALSSVVLVVFFAPMLLLGFAINATLVLLVVSDVWSPAAAGG